MGDGEKRKWSCAINSIATIFHLSKMLWYFDSFFKVDICICFKSSRFHHNLMQTISFLCLRPPLMTFVCHCRHVQLSGSQYTAFKNFETKGSFVLFIGRTAWQFALSGVGNRPAFWAANILYLFSLNTKTIRLYFSSAAYSLPREKLSPQTVDKYLPTKNVKKKIIKRKKYAIFLSLRTVVSANATEKEIFVILPQATSYSQNHFNSPMDLWLGEGLTKSAGAGAGAGASRVLIEF